MTYVDLLLEAEDLVLKGLEPLVVALGVALNLLQAVVHLPAIVVCNVKRR